MVKAYMHFIWYSYKYIQAVETNIATALNIAIALLKDRQFQCF